MDIPNLSKEELEELLTLWDFIKTEKQSTQFNKFELKKQVFIFHYKDSYGNITYSAKQAKIDRGTYYNWIKDDALFKGYIDSINIDDLRVEEAEHMLAKGVRAADNTCIIFTLKTKGKHKGYVEKQEIVQSGGFTLNVTKTYIKKEEGKDE